MPMAFLLVSQPLKPLAPTGLGSDQIFGSCPWAGLSPPPPALASGPLLASLVLLFVRSGGPHAWAKASAHVGSWGSAGPGCRPSFPPPRPAPQCVWGPPHPPVYSLPHSGVSAGLQGSTVTTGNPGPPVGEWPDMCSLSSGWEDKGSSLIPGRLSESQLCYVWRE